MKPQLTIQNLISEASVFCQNERIIENNLLYGITDGKASPLKENTELLIKTQYESVFATHITRKY